MARLASRTGQTERDIRLRDRGFRTGARRVPEWGSNARDRGPEPGMTWTIRELCTSGAVDPRNLPGFAAILEGKGAHEVMPIPLIAGAAVGLKAIGAKLLAGGAAKGFLAKLGLGKLGIGKFFAGLFKKAGLKGLFKNPAKLMDTMQDIRQTARMVRQARMTANAVQQTARRIT